MKCAIMQPTYLPWSGYFNLISQVDNFVFLDDVQFERRSWQTRNRILLQGRECLVIVPVNKARRSTRIKDIVINNQPDWRPKQWQTLRAAYAKAPYGEEALALIEPFLTGTPPKSLSEFNQAIIKKIAKELELKAVFTRASDLQCPGKRSEHLIEICRKLECDEYFSPSGSSAYLKEDNFENRSGLRLTLTQFEPASYPQFRSEEFVSHLSIVDVIANIGTEATKVYIS